MGIIKAISVSDKKGVKKRNIAEAELKKDFGIVGDAHAGSVRQVSLLSEGSIGKMRQQGLKVGPGDFAENITVGGLEVEKLSPGARLNAGAGALLEITQIGKVCHDRCHIYYEAGDCVMPREGVFAKVLRSGIIRVNDSVEVVRDEKQER